MNTFFRFIRNISFPKKQELQTAVHSFSLKEWVIVSALFTVLTISALLIVNHLNNYFLVTVPTEGGTLNEGIIGTPRFINPVLAISDADRDLTTLVYSGLMKKMPSGEVVPDLADHYDISKDLLTYTFTLKDDIFFHDNSRVTAFDVVFTINKAKDPVIKSPRGVNWQGVDVTALDEKTVQFTLKQPYATFLENATIGILPSHIWKNVPSDEFSFSDFNTNAIGSGPYKIASVTKSSGIPRYFKLSNFNKYIFGKPYIQTLGIRVYANENDLVSGFKSGEVTQISSITPEIATELKKQGYNIQTTVLPRIFGLFFNQNESHVFTDKNVIKAFNLAIDRNRIVQTVLSGYGVPIDSPIPVGMIGNNISSSDGNDTTPLQSSSEDAKNILITDGWKAGTDGILKKTIIGSKGKKENVQLSFSIATGDTPELKNATLLIKEDLEKIGAHVDVSVLSIGDLNQNVIRPRKYDALFFGEIVNHESDLFAFWHSSQIKDPGLNIALYANPKADKLLADALGAIDEDTRNSKYTQFETILKNDTPAVFIYSPEFIYATDRGVENMAITHVSIASDRFSGIVNWYMEKDHVWKWFAEKTKIIN